MKKHNEMMYHFGVQYDGLLRIRVSDQLDCQIYHMIRAHIWERCSTMHYQVWGQLAVYVERAL